MVWAVDKDASASIIHSPCGSVITFLLNHRIDWLSQLRVRYHTINLHLVCLFYGFDKFDINYAMHLPGKPLCRFKYQ